MNRQEIRDRILRGLNESTSSPSLFTTAQVDAYIEDAQEILSEEVAAIKRELIVTKRSGTTYYNTRGLATDMMVPYRIWDVNNERKLEAKTLFELDSHNERWVDTTGDPWWWFPLSWDVFGIYPRPATGGGTLRIGYLAWPRTLLDDSDEPEFQNSDHDGLVLYGVYEGLLKQWDIARATQIFVKFVESWGDSSARHGARAMERRLMTRTNG